MFSGAKVIRSISFGRPQSVILTGESGAGKTSSIEHLLSFFSDSCSSSHAKERFDAAYKLIGLFGNARTFLNENSSRFTKLTKVIELNIK